MYHFFTKQEEIRQDEVWITGTDVNHIKNVLRMEKGEKISVSTGLDNLEYLCEIREMISGRVTADILEVRESEKELKNRIVLFQGLPKADKMEWIIQKAVELGASQIVPVACSRAVVKLDAKKEQARLKRWSGIAESAAKQSGRLRIPEVSRVMSWTEALAYAEKIDVKLIPYEHAQGMDRTREVLGGIEKGQSVAVFIGPEGGFEEKEVALAQEGNVLPITLGRRILRTETAGLATLAMLVYNLER